MIQFRRLWAYSYFFENLECKALHIEKTRL